MKLTKSLLSIALAAGLSANASAEMLWSSNSLTYLKSLQEFEVLTNDDVDVFTLEHASGHNWGDVFIFADRITASADADAPKHNETYMEVSARLSLDYAFGLKHDSDIVKDTFIAGTWENSSVSEPNFSTGFDNYLLGVGVAWNVPGFTYLGTNFYRANNELTDNDEQITVTWGYPIVIGQHKIMIDGYIDWSSAADDHAADFHFNPQVRLDVGNYFDKPNTVDVGIEYSYWHNKFGLDFLDDEHVVSAIVKVYL